MHNIIDVIIIGSGPAGYTAAIYTSRAGLDTILYQGIQPGGQLTTTTDVENYPGYPNGVKGVDMMLDFKEQAGRFGADIFSSAVTAVRFDKYPFEVFTDDKNCMLAKAIIIATGASSKYLGIPSEQRLLGRGVSTCVTCDGFFFKNKNVAVVGGGDSAVESVLYLSRICKSVFMFVRSDKLRASHIMQTRLFERSNVTLFWNSEPIEVIGTDEVVALRYVNSKTSEEETLPIQGIFVSIGHKPNSDIFPVNLKNDLGYIITKPGTSKTTIEGVFAAGDVQDNIYRQAITAAASGCMAAIDTERFLLSK